MYSYDKFLRPITTTDRNIQIMNDSGIVKYTVNPFSVINVMISNNLLKINMKQGRVILVNFSSVNESKLAIIPKTYKTKSVLIFNCVYSIIKN